jgi:hypothetical protein
VTNTAGVTISSIPERSTNINTSGQVEAPPTYFDLGPFNVPGTPGNYRVVVRLETNGGGQFIEGYRDLNVTDQNGAVNNPTTNVDIKANGSDGPYQMEVGYQVNLTYYANPSGSLYKPNSCQIITQVRPINSNGSYSWFATENVSPGGTKRIVYNSLRSPAGDSWQYYYRCETIISGVFKQDMVIVNVTPQPYIPPGAYDVSCTGTVISPNPYKISWNAFTNPSTPPQGSTYAYWWQGSDGLTGSSQRVVKQYGLPRADQTAQVTVANRGTSHTANCTVKAQRPIEYKEF